MKRPNLFCCRTELEDTIGRDQLELALKRAESENRERKMSETSGTASPPKAGSRQSLNRSLSQETSPRKNLRSRQNSVMPKDEKKEPEQVRSKIIKVKRAKIPKVYLLGSYAPLYRKV